MPKHQERVLKFLYCHPVDVVLAGISPGSAALPKIGRRHN
jgi:hypothetical protein